MKGLEIEEFIMAEYNKKYNYNDEKYTNILVETTMKERNLIKKIEVLEIEREVNRERCRTLNEKYENSERMAASISKENKKILNKNAELIEKNIELEKEVEKIHSRFEIMDIR